MVLPERSLGDHKSEKLEMCTKYLCEEDDVQEDEMKVFKIDELGEVLLLRYNSELSAVGAKCTHYGAPLINGVLANGYIRCPWHGACFNATCGDIEDFPGLDSLPRYQLVHDDGKVFITYSKDDLLKSKRVKPMNPDTRVYCNSTFVIIGGGAAGNLCCETLRQEGFGGKLLMITKDENIPYDRTKLSKAMPTSISAIALRSEAFYSNGKIDILINREVIDIDTNKKTLTLDDCCKLKYDSLLIATGGQPNKCLAANSDLNNIFYLRTLNDANKIVEKSQGKTVVVVGTSFIAMEVAASLVGKASQIQIVGRGNTPFGPVFGEAIGNKLKDLFVKKGVEFHLNTEITEFLGAENCEGVKLKDGTNLKADVCVVGIGVSPSTSFLKDSPLNLNERGFVKVNKYLQTNDPSIFAAGDIIEFPLPLAKKCVTIGHWQVASKQGNIAAFNMLGKKTAFKTVPFFWSSLFGKSIRYAGFCDRYDDIVLDMNEDSDSFSFIAYYVQDDVVVAVATANRDPLAAKFATLLEMGKVYEKDDIECNPLESLNVDCFGCDHDTSL